MKKTNLRQIGNSLGVVLPKTLLARAGFSLDTPLDVIATHGEIRLVPCDGIAVVLTKEEVHALLAGDLTGPDGLSAAWKLKASQA
jgi:antitoxin component of MazEF toxin-antitoxin module